MPGNAFCKFRKTDCASFSVWRLVLPSVFHFSIRRCERSSCAACEACCRLPISWFSSEIDEYETGAEALLAGACAILVPASSIAEQQRTAVFVMAFMLSL